MPTDEEIAREVQQGDSQLFGVLVKRYEEKITRYVRKFILGEEVRDTVQEIFLKAFTNIQSFDATRRFSPWLYRIAHNESVNAGKKRLRLPFFTFDLDTLLPHRASPETVHGLVEKRELADLLNRSLEKLDPKYREPLVLYYLEDMDYREIAEIMHIPISTVGVRLARGKTQLQKYITQYDG